MKRNYHKVSKISVKKKKGNLHSLSISQKRKIHRKMRKNMSKGMRATSYTSNYG